MSTELRAETVRLARSSGLSLPELARELGVTPQSLRNWLGQAQIDGGEREGLTSGEREELRRLRRDNARLREEREILKKPRLNTKKVSRADAALLFPVERLSRQIAPTRRTDRASKLGVAQRLSVSLYRRFTACSSSEGTAPLLKAVPCLVAGYGLQGEP